MSKPIYLKIIVLTLSMFLVLPSCKELREYKQRINAIEIEEIDLDKVKDGEYTGEYDAVLVKAKVLVKVQNHRISAIQLLKHEHGRGAAAEVIPQRVVAKQSLKVDTITKATSSSKVILEAIEQALRQGLE